MQRELNVTGDLYQTFLTGLQEATVQVGLVRADTRIMSKALSPLRPIAPKKPVIVVGSAFVGILFCAAILLIQASRNASFTSSHELENFTGYPVWGQIPKVHKRKRQDVVRFITDNPTAAVSEAVRNLRTSVLMSSLDAPPKVIMTTSSLPGEGKTTLAIMLAINLAQMGGKVLLIEADIRRRALDNYYPETDQTFGLVDAITGKIPLSEAIFRDEERSFDVLRGQMSSANPADLFSSNGFKAMIETAREKYDHIIIDTPPVLIVPDARIIAPISDTITFAVAWNRTQKNQVREGLKLIQPSAGVVMGLALSKVDQKQSSNYGSYSYGYSHYGDDYGKS
jgi:capsular exopolysaccharide synthesis family protein